MLRAKTFMDDWQDAKKQGWSSPSAFYTEWNKANPASGFIKAAQRQIGNFSGMDLPKSSDWASGTIYVAPKNMPDAQKSFLAQYGVKPGDLFRFNGRDSKGKEVQPIPKSDYFNAHLGQ